MGKHRLPPYEPRHAAPAGPPVVKIAIGTGAVAAATATLLPDFGAPHAANASAAVLEIPRPPALPQIPTPDPAPLADAVSGAANDVVAEAEKITADAVTSAPDPALENPYGELLPEDFVSGYVADTEPDSADSTDTEPEPEPEPAPPLDPVFPAAEPAPEPPPLDPAAAVPAPAHDWTGVAQCESSGDWTIVDSAGNHFGGLQFSQSTWEAYGGGEYAPSANLATPEQQIAVAEKVLIGQGAGAWPVCGQFLAPLAENPPADAPAAFAPPPGDPAPEPGDFPPCPVPLEGLTPSTDYVHRALCANFPEVPEYGGVRHDADAQDHGTGNAIDAMVYDNTDLGNRIADYLLAHTDTFGLKYVIWQQRIAGPWNGWTWELMEDRGSPTNNHEDHVHTSVY